MTKYILGLLVLSSSILNQAQATEAKLTELRCSTDSSFMGNSIHRFRFRVQNLTSKGALRISYLDRAAESDGEVVRVTAPKQSRLKALNENSGIKRVPDGIELSGDSDGCEFVTLRLYSDSQFKTGYVRVNGETGCGSGSGYSRVTCKLKVLSQ